MSDDNRTNPLGTTSQHETSHKEAAKEVGQEAKAQAGQLKDEAAEQARNVLSDAKTQAEEATARGKTQVAEHIGSIAHAFHSASEQLEREDQHEFAQYSERIASQVGQVSDYLSNKSVGDLMHAVENFARREPGLFLGGAALVGLVGGRFLQSSRRDQGSMNYGYSQSNAYPRGSYPNQGGYGEYQGELRRDTATASAATSAITPGKNTPNSYEDKDMSQASSLIREE